MTSSIGSFQAPAPRPADLYKPPFLDTNDRIPSPLKHLPLDLTQGVAFLERGFATTAYEDLEVDGLIKDLISNYDNIINELGLVPIIRKLVEAHVAKSQTFRQMLDHWGKEETGVYFHIEEQSIRSVVGDEKWDGTAKVKRLRDKMDTRKAEAAIRAKEKLEALTTPKEAGNETRLDGGDDEPGHLIVETEVKTRTEPDAGSIKGNEALEDDGSELELDVEPPRTENQQADLRAAGSDRKRAREHGVGSGNAAKKSRTQTENSQKQGSTRPDLLMYLRDKDGNLLSVLLVEAKWSNLFKSAGFMTAGGQMDPEAERHLRVAGISWTCREAVYQTSWYLRLASRLCRARMAIAQVNEHYTRLCILEDATLAIETPWSSDVLREEVRRMQSHRLPDNQAPPMTPLTVTPLPSPGPHSSKASTVFGPIPPVCLDELDKCSSFWARLTHSLINWDNSTDKPVVDRPAMDGYSATIYAALLRAGTIPFPTESSLSTQLGAPPIPPSRSPGRIPPVDNTLFEATGLPATKQQADEAAFLTMPVDAEVAADIMIKKDESHKKKQAALRQVEEKKHKAGLRRDEMLEGSDALSQPSIYSSVPTVSGMGFSSGMEHPVMPTVDISEVAGRNGVSVSGDPCETASAIRSGHNEEDSDEEGPHERYCPSVGDDDVSREKHNNDDSDSEGAGGAGAAGGAGGGGGSGSAGAGNPGGSGGARGARGSGGAGGGTEGGTEAGAGAGSKARAGGGGGPAAAAVVSAECGGDFNGAGGHGRADGRNFEIREHGHDDAPKGWTPDEQRQQFHIGNMDGEGTSYSSLIADNCPTDKSGLSNAEALDSLVNFHANDVDVDNDKGDADWTYYRDRLQDTATTFLLTTSQEMDHIIRYFANPLEAELDAGLRCPTVANSASSVKSSRINTPLGSPERAYKRRDVRHDAHSGTSSTHDPRSGPGDENTKISASLSFAPHDYT